MGAKFSQPNTTPTPNLIFDVWLSILNEAELKILLTVVRNTLGWIADIKTQTRKEKDWISRSQLASKTGLSLRTLSSAIKVLLEQYRLIEAYNSRDRKLETGEDRKLNGGKIYYRLSIRKPDAKLF